MEIENQFQELNTQFGISIDKKKICLPDGNIKTLGATKFEVKIYPEIISQVLAVVTDTPPVITVTPEQNINNTESEVLTKNF